MFCFVDTGIGTSGSRPAGMPSGPMQPPVSLPSGNKGNGGNGAKQSALAPGCVQRLPAGSPAGEPCAGHSPCRGPQSHPPQLTAPEGAAHTRSGMTDASIPCPITAARCNDACSARKDASLRSRHAACPHLEPGRFRLRLLQPRVPRRQLALQRRHLLPHVPAYDGGNVISANVAGSASCASIQAAFMLLPGWPLA